MRSTEYTSGRNGKRNITIELTNDELQMIEESKLYKHDDCTSCGEKNPNKLFAVKIGRSQCGICITLCSKCFNKIKRIHDEKLCASEVKENVIHENL